MWVAGSTTRTAVAFALALPAARHAVEARVAPSQMSVASARLTIRIHSPALLALMATGASRGLDGPFAAAIGAVRGVPGVVLGFPWPILVHGLRPLSVLRRMHDADA